MWCACDDHSMSKVLLQRRHIKPFECSIDAVMDRQESLDNCLLGTQLGYRKGEREYAISHSYAKQ